jgi:hypothetical protein
MVSRLIKPSYQQGFARSAGESANPGLWKGKVGHWCPSLGVTGINTLYDVSGYGNNGTMNGSMTIDDWVIGRNGYALDFDGLDDYIIILDNDALDFGTGDFTVSVWAKNTGSTGGNQSMVAKNYYDGEDPAGENRWLFYIKTTAGGMLTFARDNDYTTLVYDGDYIGDNIWHHFVATRVGGDGYLYVDGVERAFASGFFIGYSFSNTYDLNIGSRLNGSENLFKGNIDEVRIYNRALTPNEIMQLYLDPLADLRLRERSMVASSQVVASTVNISLPAFTLDSTAETTHADSSLTLPSLTLDATSISIHADASLALPSLELNSSSSSRANSSLTLPSLALDATISIHADASLNLPIFTLAATSESHGTCSISLPLLTINSAALNHGASSLTLPALSLNATGAPGNISSSLTLPSLTLDATSISIHADASLNLPIFSISSTGTIIEEDVTGDVSFDLPLFSVSSNGHMATDGAFSLPSLNVQGGSGATANISLPILTVLGSTPSLGSVAITLPLLTVNSFTGALGSIILPQIVVVAGEQEGGDVTLPLFTLSAMAVKGSVPDCVVMNTINNAVTEYKGYWFNSYTKFNGVYLAANQNGIYEQDLTDTDNTGVDDFKIKAHIKSGVIDTYKDKIQRLRNAWLTFETDGDIRVVTRADQKATRRYYLTFQDIAGIKERRVKFERGIRERHFDFKVENINGSDLKIDKLTVTLEPILSKRR